MSAASKVRLGKMARSMCSKLPKKKVVKKPVQGKAAAADPAPSAAKVIEFSQDNIRRKAPVFTELLEQQFESDLQLYHEKAEHPCVRRDPRCLCIRGVAKNVTWTSILAKTSFANMFRKTRVKVAYAAKVCTYLQNSKDGLKKPKPGKADRDPWLRLLKHVALDRHDPMEEA